MKILSKLQRWDDYEDEYNIIKEIENRFDVHTNLIKEAEKDLMSEKMFNYIISEYNNQRIA
jgi:hypothetical protein